MQGPTNWQRMMAWTLAAVLAAGSLFAGRHFVQQAELHSAILKNLKPYWQVGSGKTLKREVAIGRLNDQRGNPFPAEYNAKSNLEVSIFLQVRERRGNRQKVRVHVLSRNSGWFSRVLLYGPTIDVVEVWSIAPNSEQVRNMIGNTRKQEFKGPGATVLWPRQPHLVYADFDFPYPMELDFTVSSYSFENWGEEKVKSVRDSVLVRGADLNAAKVVP